MNDGFQYMRVSPLMLLWPSLALGITIAALAFMGPVMADVVGDPGAIRWTRKQRRAAERARERRLLEQATTTGSLNYLPEDSAARVDNLRVSYPTADGEKEVVHGIQLDIV